jgi:hypothetical protein
MIYIETPISEKPDKSGWYILIMPKQGFIRHAYFDDSGSWDIVDNFTHWLKPLEGVVMSEEQLKEMIDAARTYNDGWVETPDEIIKRFYSS